MESPSEKVFYQDDDVLVTQARLVVNEKTFAMRNISSVANYPVATRKTVPVLLIIIGITCFLFGGEIFGGVLVVVAILMLFLVKDNYAVRISSNSGETNALESKSEEYIQKIVDAVNEAIIHRG